MISPRVKTLSARIKEADQLGNEMAQRFDKLHRAEQEQVIKDLKYIEKHGIVGAARDAAQQGRK